MLNESLDLVGSSARNAATHYFLRRDGSFLLSWASPGMMLQFRGRFYRLDLGLEEHP
jgi:hypothetical protein